jgi:hypothetical protein
MAAMQNYRAPHREHVLALQHRDRVGHPGGAREDPDVPGFAGYEEPLDGNHSLPRSARSATLDREIVSAGRAGGFCGRGRHDQQPSYHPAPE